MQNPQVQFQIQQPAVLAPESGKSRSRFSTRTQKVCGILQIALGVFTFFLGIAFVVLRVGNGSYVVGVGIWSSIVMIIAGSFGVVSARNEKTCPIVACMVMSILSSVAAVCVFGFSVGGCVVDGMSTYLKYHGRRIIYSPVAVSSPYGPLEPEAALAADSLGVLVAMIEFVVAIVQSAVCCRTTCCAPRPALPTVVYTQQPYAGYPGQTTGFIQGTLVPSAGGAQMMMQPVAVGGAIVQPQQPVMGATGMQPAPAPPNKDVSKVPL